MFTPKGRRAQGGRGTRKAATLVPRLRPKAGRAMMARDLSRKIGYLNLGDLIHDAEPDALDRLFGSSGWARLRFNAGDPVYPIDWCNSAMLSVERGSVDIFLDSEPDRLRIKQVGPDAVFGEMPPLGVRMFGAIAEAAERSSIIAISEAGIASIVARSPRFLRAWWRVAGARLFELEGQAVVCSYGTQPSRVVHELLTIGAVNRVIRITHQELADRLGADRASVSVVLEELERAGAISIRRGSIVIEDADALDAYRLF